jgi:hypothetical protein
MKRVVALLVAAAMVALSLYIRSRIDDGRDGSTTTSGAPRVVCSTELAAACDAVGGSVEDAGATADRLVAAEGDVELDAWVVPSPWPELVDERRSREGRDRLFGRPVALASTRLAMVAWKGKLACDGTPTWKCVGETGAKAGHADPTRDGIGLLVLGNAVVSFFDGRSDLSSTTDLEDPAFDDWFTRLEQRDTANDDALDLLLTSRGVLYGVVGVSEAEATATLAAAADRSSVELTYPAPMARAVAVVAPVRDRSVDDELRDGATAALVGRAGWSRATTPAGLPDAGFLDALLQRWTQVAR